MILSENRRCLQDYINYNDHIMIMQSITTALCNSTTSLADQKHQASMLLQDAESVVDRCDNEHLEVAMKYLNSIKGLIIGVFG